MSKLKDFTNFVREQGVVGLAVGLAIGTAAGATVKAIVDGLINPVVGYLLGGNNLAEKTWYTGLHHGTNALIFHWGSVVSSVLTLLAISAVIYFVVRGLKLDRLDKEKDELVTEAKQVLNKSARKGK